MIDRLCNMYQEKEGIVVDEATHFDLKTIVHENAKKATDLLPEGSFQQLLWEQ